MENVAAVMLGYIIPGFAIAAGILILLTRFSVKTRLWLYGHPLILEVGGLIIAWMMHGGTIVGGMAVVIAGLCITMTMSMCRTIFGYVKGGVYTRGWIKYNEADVLEEKTDATVA